MAENKEIQQVISYDISYTALHSMETIHVKHINLKIIIDLTVPSNKLQTTKKVSVESLITIYLKLKYHIHWFDSAKNLYMFMYYDQLYSLF